MDDCQCGYIRKLTKEKPGTDAFLINKVIGIIPWSSQKTWNQQFPATLHKQSSKCGGWMKCTYISHMQAQQANELYCLRQTVQKPVLMPSSFMKYLIGNVPWCSPKINSQFTATCCEHSSNWGTKWELPHSIVSPFTGTPNKWATLFKTVQKKKYWCCPNCQST